MKKVFKGLLIKLPLYLLIIVGLVLGLNFLFFPNNKLSRKILPGIRIIQAGVSQNIAGWAWASTTGWVSFNSNGCDSNPVDGKSDGVPAECPPAGSIIADYGVNIESNGGNFSGHAWSSNLGWISFNRSETGAPPSDDPCPSGNCIAKAPGWNRESDTDFNIKGWARALAACDSIPCPSSGAGTNTGGWDGWLKFNHGQTGETIFRPANDEDKFHNWAWGGDVTLGWVSVNSEEGGGVDYAVGYNCICDPWSTASAGDCGIGSCPKGEAKLTRTCTPDGCNPEEKCAYAFVCWHKECKNNKCVDIVGPETKPKPDCTTDSGCLLKPWLNWKWWEIIPKLNK